MNDLTALQMCQSREQLLGIRHHRIHSQSLALAMLFHNGPQVFIETLEDHAQVIAIVELVPQSHHALTVFRVSIVQQRENLDLFLRSLPHHAVVADNLDGHITFPLRIPALHDIREDTFPRSISENHVPLKDNLIDSWLVISLTIVPIMSQIHNWELRLVHARVRVAVLLKLVLRVNYEVAKAILGDVLLLLQIPLHGRHINATDRLLWLAICGFLIIVGVIIAIFVLRDHFEQTGIQLHSSSVFQRRPACITVSDPRIWGSYNAHNVHRSCRRRSCWGQKPQRRVGRPIQHLHVQITDRRPLRPPQLLS
mmetsp:Transcript_23808/g.57734  ORF Transcript_23808/g.57734 Transcript_23808/m.57734 type:complete len:310 (+) Transcript_23808:932-1861(+)